jgi:hypothetical protein
MENEDENRKYLKLGDLHRIGLIIAVCAIIFMLYYQIVFG